MSNSENDPYRQMTTPEIRRWLTASCVVATAFTLALVTIATNNFGRGWTSAAQQAEVSGPSEAALARTEE
jgi:hypothetical protein